MNNAFQTFRSKLDNNRNQLIVVLAVVLLLCVALAVALVTTNQGDSSTTSTQSLSDTSRTVATHNVVAVSNVRSITLTTPWDGLKQLDYAYAIPDKDKTYLPGTVYYVTMAPQDYNTVASHYNALASLIYLGEPVVKNMGIPYNDTVEYRLVPR